jgi:hypothetical protein
MQAILERFYALMSNRDPLCFSRNGVGRRFQFFSEREAHRYLVMGASTLIAQATLLLPPCCLSQQVALIWCKSVQVHYRHLHLVLTLKPADYSTNPGDHLVRYIPGKMKLRCLPSVRVRWYNLTLSSSWNPMKFASMVSCTSILPF